MRPTILATLFALAPAIALAQQPCSNARQVVDAIYLQVLERAASGEGDQMVAQLQNGQTTVRELVRSIAKSQEHEQRFGQGNNNDARVSSVTYLYRHVLGRTPDPGGLRTHIGTLNTNGADAVIDSLVDSPEYQRSFGDSVVPGSRTRFCGPGQTAGLVSGRMRFQGMDANKNGMIERSEWNGSQQSFAVHDWNRDNVLSGDEVRPGFQRRAGARTEEDFDPFSTSTWTEQDFRQLDRNRDNRITASEWYYEAESFRRADRNRDNVLSLQEFTGTEMDDDRTDRFDYLDTNKNGRIEQREWHGTADAFEWLDRNGDNVLSRAEVVGQTSNDFNSFASLDADRNGTLSVNEWYWSRRSFDGYDTDRDGVITRREFAAAGGAPTTVR